jgi:hypothetical protein
VICTPEWCALGSNRARPSQRSAMEIIARSETRHLRGYTRSMKRGPIDSLVADLVLALGSALLNLNGQGMPPWSGSSHQLRPRDVVMANSYRGSTIFAAVRHPSVLRRIFLAQPAGEIAASSAAGLPWNPILHVRPYKRPKGGVQT